MSIIKKSENTARTPDSSIDWNEVRQNLIQIQLAIESAITEKTQKGVRTCYSILFAGWVATCQIFETMCYE